MNSRRTRIQPEVFMKQPDHPDDTLTPTEMAAWLRQEVRDITKSAELRIQDATDFVTGYLAGTLSPKQANDRWLKYSSRWGEDFPGFNVDEKMTDHDILGRLDEPATGHERFARASRSDQETPRRGR